ncbi:LOW QUALITY PROTEIN: hypothetical protein IFM46972_08493 [Aspergillus udagawae]|uniref:Uncharacterized protein n=1 Tax=Aspergillus udagawae TaxID=91492 RepID=A0A8H3S324_9EURO|nr:LOW QUALITY PROTEIN: hypothetical protein IFM46972_08493 [Aspergillus udagawae]
MAKFKPLTHTYITAIADHLPRTHSLTGAAAFGSKSSLRRGSAREGFLAPHRSNGFCKEVL